MVGPYSFFVDAWLLTNEAWGRVAILEGVILQIHRDSPEQQGRVDPR